eukprot:SAG11_NODE_23985_length_380_cov_0.501779_1_plen_94_part_01
MLEDALPEGQELRKKVSGKEKKRKSSSFRQTPAGLRSEDEFDENEADEESKSDDESTLGAAAGPKRNAKPAKRQAAKTSSAPVIHAIQDVPPAG